MHFLANENFSLDAVEAVRQAGHDVIWIRTDAPGSRFPNAPVALVPIPILALASRENPTSCEPPVTHSVILEDTQEDVQESGWRLFARSPDLRRE